ncbi:sugar ABC transporter ATP-binding protein [Acidisoma cellulosilytica]|uniref:Sugar ABC transporter ATP-binding protein n=1 Tax=Acidisoma cellulosilyticum TaxID=2802395 RepID=A0A963Z1U6_9PROT|nr:sugar ABC transporter ATP-binding protein [Acidisoma cellulosilyticum]MCB8881164.1 sugar ABC transporter ATP-binding protein [Acidisoma cellulosilyticum]
MTSVSLAARDVSKAFFGNPVLRGVSIELRPGRVHALMGENGAGKSTLINILSGSLSPDSGSLDVGGRTASSLSPAEARQAGIAVVHQELSLVAHLSIAENIGLGAYASRGGRIDYSALAVRAAELCALVGLSGDLSRPIRDLPLGERQLVEIAKALYRNPKVLILDEPTSSLSARETERLMALLRRLKANGVALLYISHRLGEVMDLCDHVTVLKDGVCTADQPMAGMTPDEFVRLMVGRDAGDLFPAFESAARAETVIDVAGLSAGMVQDAALTLRRGEILGLGGLVGQGQEDLLLALYGAMPARARTATMLGAAGLVHSVTAANRRGIAYVPADRKREGLLLTHSIRFNMLLPDFGRAVSLALRRTSTERKLTDGLARLLTVKGDLSRPVQALSGGNQQKVALAKWMPQNPKILLLNDPTRGVDVQTKREIYLMLRRFAQEGQAIILLSSDTPELVHLCDRVLVMREGNLVAELPHGQVTEESIVAAAMGVSPAREAA